MCIYITYNSIHLKWEDRQFHLYKTIFSKEMLRIGQDDFDASFILMAVKIY